MRLILNNKLSSETAIKAENYYVKDSLKLANLGL